MPRSMTSSEMPAVALGGSVLHRGDHEVGVDAVGDERLRAVDDVVVAVARARWSPSPARSEPMPGLGHRDRRDQLARRRCPGSQRSRCSVGAVAQEVRQADVVVQRDARARRRRRRPRWHSSPITRLNRKSSTPPPPYSSGTAIARKPPRPAAAKSSRGTMPVALPLRVVGPTSRSRNVRKLARKSSCRSSNSARFTAATLPAGCRPHGPRRSQALRAGSPPATAGPSGR